MAVKPRLIDADALRREVQQIAFHGNGGILTVQAINNAPAVDAIPVQWLEEWCRKHDKLTLYYIMMGDRAKECSD